MRTTGSSLHDERRQHGTLRPLWLGGAAVAALAAAATADGVAPGDERGAKPAAAVVTAPTERNVDLVICLDTSGSMDGLIDAAKQKLWSIVNDLALAQPTPRLRVALLTFGNDGHSAEKGWVRIDSPFTEDLDLISQQLFALHTNGGTEYVGRVLQAAAQELAWSAAKAALKLVIVAGNEAAEQDPVVDFREVCKALIEQGVVVNSIYCGNPQDELAPAWREVALKADGQFAAIDQQNGTVVIATPFDADLTKLSAAINETYLWFGANAERCDLNQWEQDANAANLNSATAAARALTKCAAVYRNDADLVEALKAGKVKLEEVKKEELPEKMREMTLEQKQKCVADAGAKRAGIAKKMQEVGKQRDQFVAQEMKKLGQDDKSSFDYAVRGAVRKQAEAKGFQFPKEPKVDDAMKKPDDVKPAEPKPAEGGKVKIH